MSIIAYIAAAVLGVAFRYALRLTEACLFVGKAISDSESKTGFQDAVSPPIWTPITFAIWGGMIALIGWSFWSLGWVNGLIVIVILFGTSSIAGRTVIPRADAPYWVKMIYASMARRVAAYRKANDHMRADAGQDLAHRIETRLADKFRA